MALSTFVMRTYYAIVVENILTVNKNLQLII